MSLDVAAMKALVGAASVSLEEARAILDESRATADDLETPTLRPLWALLEARVRNRAPIDAVGVVHALAGQPEALRAVAVDVVVNPDMLVARERLGLMREAGVRRRLVEALREVAVAAKAGRPLSELDAMLREAPALLAGAASRVRNCAGDSLAMLDALEAQWRGLGPKRLLTGMGDLDEALGGLINNLIVVGARPGVGKSALVAGLVRGWVGEGVKVGVLCYEDDARDMEARLIAARAGVSLRQVRGDLFANQHQQESIAEGFAWWHGKESLLEVDDARPSGTVADVLASIRTMADRGCRVVVLDNMTCVRLDGPEDRRHDLLVERALSDIRGEAQHLRMPIIVMGHIKRAQGDNDEAQRPPKLSDFSNSVAWENYSRVALGMWRSESGPCLRVLKQTNGPAGADFELDVIKEAAVITGARIMANMAPAASEEPAPRQRPRRGGYE